MVCRWAAPVRGGCSGLVAARDVLGRSMRAIRENEIGPKRSGQHAAGEGDRPSPSAAVIGALGGLDLCVRYLYISPDTVHFDTRSPFWHGAGGRDRSVLGAILGASLLTFLPEWLRELKKIYLVIYGLHHHPGDRLHARGAVGYVKLLGRRFARGPPCQRPCVRPCGRPRRAGRGDPRVEKLTKRFGGLVAVDEVDLAVRRGEAHALIGPNGSGQDDVHQPSVRLYVPTSGRIRFLNQDIGGQRPSRIAVSGMARSFQNLRLFRELSVWENVLVGRIGAEVTRPRPGRRALAAIEFVGLSDKAHELCRNLPYGHQKLVELARAIAESRNCCSWTSLGRSEPDGEAGTGAAAQAVERDGTHDPDRGARHVTGLQGRLRCHCPEFW